MAVTRYGSVGDVAALVPQYTSGGSFSTSSRPTSAQVGRFLERISALVNVILAQNGFTTPVEQEDALAALSEFVIEQVVQLAHAANRAGVFAPGSERLKGGETPFSIILEDAQTFVEEKATGLEALGVVRERGLTDGLAVRTADDGGREIVAPFQRRQMGNVIEDWDT